MIAVAVSSPVCCEKVLLLSVTRAGKEEILKKRCKKKHGAQTLHSHSDSRSFSPYQVVSSLMARRLVFAFFLIRSPALLMVVKHRSSSSCYSSRNAVKGKEGSGSCTFRNSEARPTLFFSLQLRALNAACSRGGVSEAVTQHPELSPHHSFNSFSLNRSRITLSVTRRKWKNMRRQAGHEESLPSFSFSSVCSIKVLDRLFYSRIQVCNRGILLTCPRKKEFQGSFRHTLHCFKCFHRLSEF